MLNKIVIRFLNGALIRGHTPDFDPDKEEFHIITRTKQGDQSLMIHTNLLKAVFFVKDLNGNGNASLRRSFNEFKDIRTYGKKVKVEFLDGDILYGITNGFSVQGQGFFFDPIDKANNNERIFAVLTALKEITFL
jgi:hypothetical protein